MKSQVKTLRNGYEAPVITCFTLSPEAGFCISGDNQEIKIDDSWGWDNEIENQ